MIFFLLKKIILFFLILCMIPNTFAMFNPIEQVSLISHLDTKDNLQNSDEKFSNEQFSDEKLGYSLGVSLGSYVNQSFEQQKKIGIEINKNSLLEGVKDAISGHVKLSHEEIASILKKFRKILKEENKIQFEKKLKENFIQGELYMKNFSKIKGVKKTPSGLLYLIQEPGAGINVTNSTTITVHYKGKLVNGIEFDNSYKRGQPVSLILKDVILGWQEGLKYIHKGGKIKLVIPPHLAYGSKEVNGIPGNSTLIFDIELLDTVN